MKRTAFLVLLLGSCSFLFAQRDSIPADARYKNIFDECGRSYAKSMRLRIEKKDTIVNFISDSGKLYAEKEFLEMPLEDNTNHTDLPEKILSTRTVFSLLFRNNFLTHDNIIHALKPERKGVSQYNDTLDYTLNYAPGDIEIFELSSCPTPNYITGNTICFEIGFVQDNDVYTRYHFKLVLEIPASCKKNNLLKKIKAGRMKCLLYQGFEI